MTNADPEQRPTADQALHQWLEIRGTIFVVNREWRPRPRVEYSLETASLDVMSAYSVSVYFARAVYQRLCGR